MCDLENESQSDVGKHPKLCYLIVNIKNYKIHDTVLSYLL